MGYVDYSEVPGEIPADEAAHLEKLRANACRVEALLNWDQVEKVRITYRGKPSAGDPKVCIEYTDDIVELDKPLQELVLTSLASIVEIEIEEKPQPLSRTRIDELLRDYDIRFWPQWWSDSTWELRFESHSDYSECTVDLTSWKTITFTKWNFSEKLNLWQIAGLSAY